MNSIYRHFFLNQTETAFHLGVFRFLAFLSALILFSWQPIYKYLYLPEVLWNPSGVFAFIPIHSIPDWSFRPLYSLFQIALLFSAVGLFTRTSISVSTALSFFFVGGMLGHGNSSHVYYPYVYVFLVFLASPCSDAFSIDSILFEREPDRSAAFPDPRYGWAFRAVQFIFCSIFFSAGVTKLRVSGVSWVTSDLLQENLRLVKLHFGELGVWSSGLGLNELVSEHPLLCKTLAFSGLSLELMAPIAFLSRKAAPWIVSMIAAMQVFIYLIIYANFAGFFILYCAWLPYGQLLSFRASSPSSK